MLSLTNVQIWWENRVFGTISGISPNILIEFFCLTFNMCHRLCMADYEEVFRRIMEFEKADPLRNHSASLKGAAEHLPGSTRPPR